MEEPAQRSNKYRLCSTFHISTPNYYNWATDLSHRKYSKKHGFLCANLEVIIFADTPRYRKIRRSVSVSVKPMWDGSRGSADNPSVLLGPPHDKPHPLKEAALKRDTALLEMYLAAISKTGL